MLLRRITLGVTMRRSLLSYVGLGLLLHLSMGLSITSIDMISFQSFLDKFQGGIIVRFGNFLVPMTKEEFKQSFNRKIWSVKRPEEQEKNFRGSVLKKRATVWPARILRIFWGERGRNFFFEHDLTHRGWPINAALSGNTKKKVWNPLVAKQFV